MTSTRVVAIVEARLGSNRLPGKVMRLIVGKPMLALLMERLRRARRLDGIGVATTLDRGDDPIETLARELGVGCFRGSVDDVLDRVLKAAHAAAADVIVKITGDCPLTDPDVVEEVVGVFVANSFDFVGNGLRPTFPGGFGVRVFSTTVLERVHRLTRKPPTASTCRSTSGSTPSASPCTTSKAASPRSTGICH